MIPGPLTKLVCPVFLALHAGELLLLPQAVHLGLTVPGADSAGSVHQVLPVPGWLHLQGAAGSFFSRNYSCADFPLGS